jgi:hypothetical protein
VRVTLWIEDLRNADAAAARNLWNHFVARLYELGRKFVETCEFLFQSLDDPALKEVVTLRPRIT